MKISQKYQCKVFTVELKENKKNLVGIKLNKKMLLYEDM